MPLTPTTLNKGTLADNIATAIAAGVPSFKQVLSHAQMPESIVSWPSAHAYVESWTPTVLTAQAGITRWMITAHIDVFATPRNDLGADMEKYAVITDALDTYLQAQLIARPPFGITGIKALGFEGRRQLWVYGMIGEQPAQYMGARYVLTLTLH